MIRKLQAEDRTQLINIINEIKIFSTEEKNIAVELIDEALLYQGEDNYNIFVIVDNEKIVGYHCIGKRSLTDGVYDLYWIVVKESEQGKQIGTKLLNHAEEFVRMNNGRWLLAETSSIESYDKTRNFYFRNNYSVVAQINDFYQLGNNLIVFGKYIKI
ncbi:MAG: GNAT family N-acetyltransferase [Melioribacteraceae bacterium]|nr:GNAT family N-acetyltransferase [Melioribacteraceae bacterium]MCF8353494.1 GNAT family N-acetyltransferase [Melioribacteraceae bacterium]MCF8392623.1 GNAT family N-acetyltransferase [Melioribacteraceae bacterium]MCF8418505.1 GNAT family N-acetyltransferase [Melioribacteraceae bacterium]